MRSTALLPALLATALAMVVAQPARTADHRDAPLIAEDGRADLLDVYAFVNGNNGNVVLAMTVNPFIVPGTIQHWFSPSVLYQFKIDNTGDFREDLVIQATFDAPAPGQQLALRGPSRPRNVGSSNQPLTTPPVAAGPADGTVITASGGVKAFAGLRDDPFFVDLIWVLRLIGAAPGGPLTRQPGFDTLAGLNCSIIAVELPASLLRGSLGNKINFWGVTNRPKVTIIKRGRKRISVTNFVQVDATAKPVINTVLVGRAPGSGGQKDVFNFTEPAKQAAGFRTAAIEVVVGLRGGDRTTANPFTPEQLIDALIPDVLTLDMTSTAGFSALNGRRPEDDVIDLVLTLATNGGVKTDNVGQNDSAFLSDFPFFAAPHQPSESVPPRN